MADAPASPRPRVASAFRLIPIGVGLVGVSLAVVHSAPVRAWALRKALSAARASFGLELQASELRYNLFTRSAELRDVVVAAGTSPARPFMQADSVALRVGARSVLGSLDIQRITLRRPRLTVVEGRQGGNLPRGGGEGAAVTLPAIDVNDLDVAVETDAMRLDMRGLAISLAPSSREGDVEGQVEARNGFTLEIAGTTVDVASASTVGSFDGRLVSIERLDLNRSGTSLSGHGTVEASGAEPQVDLEFGVTTDPATWPLDRWRDHLPNGLLNVALRVSGPRANPRASITAAGPELESRGFGQIALTATGSWQDGTVTVDESAVRMADGDVRIGGSIATGSLKSGRLAIEWSGLDLGRVAEGLTDDSTLADGMTSSGAGTLAWQSPTASGSPVRMRVQASGDVVSGGESVPVSIVAAGAGSTWRLDVDSEPPAWTAHVGADIRLDGDNWLRSPVDGRVAVRVIEPRGVLDRLTAFGIAVDAIDATTIAGTITTEGVLSGPLLALRFSGSVGARSMTASGAPTVDGDATVAFALSRSESLPRVAFTFDSRNLNVGGYGTGSLSVSGQGSFDAIEVEQLALTQAGGGVLTASGRFDLGTRVIQLSAEGHGLEGSHAVGGEPESRSVVAIGNGSLSTQITGPLDDLRGQASLSIESLSIGGHAVGQLTVDATLADDETRVSARAPGVGLDAEAQLVLRAPYTFSTRGRLSEFDLASWPGMRTAGLQDEALVQGTVDGAFEVAGTLDDLQVSDATVEISPTDVYAYGVGFQIHDTLRLTLADRRVRMEPIRMTAEGISLTVDGDAGTDGADGRLTLAVDGSLDGTPAWPPSTLNVDGVLEGRTSGRITARRTASGLEMVGSVDLDVPALRRGDEVLAERVRLGVDLTGSRAEIRDLSVSAFGLVASATASVPLAWSNNWLPEGWGFADAPADQPATVKATARGTAVSMLRAAGFVPEEGTGGDVAIDAQFSAARPSVDALTGEVRLSEWRLSTAAVSLEQSEPTVVQIADGRMAIERLEWRGPGTSLTGSGSIGLSTNADSRVALDVDGDLRLIDAIVPGRLTGRLAGSVVLENRSGAWLTDATATLSDGNWLLPDAQLLFSAWSGTVSVTDQSLVLTSVAGRINDGTVRLSGRVPFEAASAGAVQLDGEHILLNVPEGLRSELSGALTWQHRTDDTPTLQGTVTVTANRYTEPVTRMLELVDAMAPAPGDTESSLPPWIANTILDVALEVTDPVVIDNSLGSVELVPNLRLVGSLEVPALTGTVDTLEDSRIQIGGRGYRLRDSALRFSPATGLMPTFDALGETTVGDYDVEVRVTGTADRIEFAYTSSPPLSQPELRRLLFTGQAGEGGDEDNTQALAAASSDVLGFAGKFVGLDSVKLGATDLDLVSKDRSTAPHITISKALGRYFEVIVSDNLETGAFTWVVIVRPATGYEARVAAIETIEHSVEFRQERLFGPGVAPPRIDSSAAADRSVVDSVVITGAMGFPEPEVRGQLRLHAGDPFDVRGWTEDRLRVERFYRNRGYHRVRIVPTRDGVERGDGQRHVVLTYDIDRGPLTQVAIEGGTLSSGAVSEIYDAWRGIPIAEVLESEFVRIARVDLFRRGYLRPEVQVAFAADTPDMSRAVVHIDPGARTERRELIWSGNVVVATTDLEAIAAAQPPRTSVWIDPRTVVGSIQGQYARLGYYDVQVSVGSPSFENRAARLAITIDEGVATVLTEVTINGVDPSQLAQARAAFGLQVGANLGSTDVRDAEQRLEAYYRRLGYSAAEVTAAASRQEQAASVTAAVSRGPRQVIEEIRVAGAASTVPPLVAEAIVLQPGQPALPVDVETTRRNLYDVGSFRRVEVTLDPAGASPPFGEEQPVVASVRLEEPQRFQLRYGLQFSREGLFSGQVDTPVRFGGSAELRDRNFFGRGMQGSVGFRYDPDLTATTVLFSAPPRRQWPVRTNVFARDRTESGTIADTDVSNRIQEVTVTQQWRVTPAIQMTWGYEVSSQRLRLSSGTGRTDFPSLLTGPTASIAIDRRDDPFETRQGWFHSTSLQLGFDALGSDLGYYRVLAVQQQFASFGPITLAGRARAGLLRAFSGTPPLTTLDLLFTAGGTSSVRGYSQASLSAVNLFDSLRLGGTDLLVLNGEIRFPVFRWFSGVAFLDAGNTFVHGFRPADLAAGFGGGLRLHTPVAIIRVDLGRPLDHTLGLTGWRWHFSVGQMF